MNEKKHLKIGKKRSTKTMSKVGAPNLSFQKKLIENNQQTLEITTLGTRKRFVNETQKR